MRICTSWLGMPFGSCRMPAAVALARDNAADPLAGGRSEGAVHRLPGPDQSDLHEQRHLTDTSTAGIGTVGLQDLATLTVTNTGAGTISATGADGIGIYVLQDANVTNFGTIAATGDFSSGIAAGRDVSLNNSGTVTADGNQGSL